MGRVNTYLIEDDPLTLIDSGPNSARALDELQHQLAERGHSIDDIELIILTHQHIDHLGLIDIIANHSGAEVAALDKLVPFVENYSEAMKAEDEYATAIMLHHGIPEELIQALATVSRAFHAWGAKASVSKPLADGETLRLGDRSLEVLWRPGHSPSDTVFWDEHNKVLFAADHLIAHISSNPLIHRPLPNGDALESPRPQALVTYLESLEKTRRLDAEIVLPGHGDPIADHRKLIDQRFDLHRRRAEKIYGLIAEQPRTAYDIAQALWGNIAVTQAYLTLSEVLGHTDILLNEGRVSESESDGVVVFEATGS